MASIAVAAKRYDGGSGSAVFTGCIPLKPGQLMIAKLNWVALWDGASELGTTVSALPPRHPDGSIRVIRLSTTLTLASGVQQDLTLKIGDAVATVAGPTEPTITETWLLAPLLLGVTDAAHLCAARIAPFPLVPLSDPFFSTGIGLKWKTFLTTEFDDPTPNATYPNFGMLRPYVLANTWTPDGYRTGGGAIYDATAAVYYRYLVSGELDRLADAHRTIAHRGPLSVAPNPVGYAYNPANFSYPPSGGPGYAMMGITWPNGKVKYWHASGGHAAGSSWLTQVDWPSTTLPYPGLSTPWAAGYNEEWTTGFHADLWFAWVLGGWEQALRTQVAYALEWMGGKAGHIFGAEGQFYWVHSTPYGPRQQLRQMCEGQLYFAQCNVPEDVTFGTINDATIPSILTNRADWLSYFQWKLWDTQEELRSLFPDGNFHKNSWGFSPYYSIDGVHDGGYPNFDGVLVLATMQHCYLNLLPDTRYRARMLAYAYQLLGQVRGPFAVGGQQLYAMPYMNFDGVTAAPNFKDASGNTLTSAQTGLVYYSVTQLLAVWTWAYAASGDPAFLTVADAHATNTSWVEGPSGWKQLGQVYSMAFAAAAWRAGVPWDGWEIGGGAALSADFSFAQAPNSLRVNFLDTSAGAPHAWAWTFGDGQTSTAQNPSHTYSASGIYSVQLTVTGTSGQSTSAKTVTVSGSLILEPADVSWVGQELTIESSHRRVLVSDDFSRSNGALGASWTNYHTPTGGATKQALAIVGNRVRYTGSGNLPTVVGVGTPGAGIGDVIPGLPAGWQADDVFLLGVETRAQTVSAPSGWTEVTGSPKTDAVNLTRLTLFWRRAVGGDTAPTVTDPGDHAVAAIIGIRGCLTGSDPASVISGGAVGGSPVNPIPIPGATTTVDNCLVVAITTDHSSDGHLPRYTAYTNADLGSLTKQLDTWGGSGGSDGGGGLGMFTGTKATAGAYGTTNVTFYISSVWAGYMTVALAPAPSSTNDGAGLTGVSLPDTQWAQIAVPTCGAGSVAGVGVRWADAPTYSGYLAKITAGTPNSLALIKYDEPTPTTLGTSAVAPTAGDVVRVEAIGDALTVYLNDAAVIATTDATFASGTAFLVARNVTDAAQTELDDFAAGDWAPITLTSLEPVALPWTGQSLSINAKTMVALAAADVAWTGGDLSFAQRTILDPVAMPWTGATMAVNGRQVLNLDPADIPWTGGSLAIQQSTDFVPYYGFLTGLRGLTGVA